MSRPPSRLAPSLVALIAPLIVVGVASPAPGGLIATDSYPIGTDPTAGQYQVQPNDALKGQPANLTTPGFVTGPYNQGSGTSNFIADPGGLSYPPFNGSPSANDGDVKFTGAPIDTTVRSVARAFSSVPASTTYFFNILVSQDGTATLTSNSFVLAGFGNSTPPTPTAPGMTSNEVQGLYFGFAQDDGTRDLVARYRNGTDTVTDTILVSGTAGTARVFDIVAELTVNQSGAANGTLTYFVNPTNYSSTATLAATSLATGTVATQAYAPSGNPAADAIANFSRLTYTAQNWTGVAKFDEVRFGTTLADVTPTVAVPEPGSIVLLGLGMVGGLGIALRRRALARSSGRLTSSGRRPRPRGDRRT